MNSKIKSVEEWNSFLEYIQIEYKKQFGEVSDAYMGGEYPNIPKFKIKEVIYSFAGFSPADKK